MKEKPPLNNRVFVPQRNGEYSQEGAFKKGFFVKQLFLRDGD